MTELTHHDADDGFHEIQLSGKQLVFAFMLTASVAVFIFLLGVQVGRNARTAARGDETAASTPPSSSAATPAAAEQVPPPTAGSTSGGETSAPSPEKFDYTKRLESQKPVPEKLNAKANTDAAAAATAPVPAPEAQEVPAAKEPVKAAKETPKNSPAEEHTAPAKSAPVSGARPGVWVVQLVALKDRGAASAVVQRLSAKGYPAFVVSPSPGAPTIYRVQVGRYNDRREAEQIAKRLEKEEQFKPWISH